jgi:type II secretory pathway component PulM
MPRGNVQKKRGRPRKIDQARESKLAEDLERLKGMLADDEEERFEHDLHAVHASERRQQQKLNELELRNKKLMMWVGIVFVMVVIVIFWMLNIDTIVGGGKKDLKMDISSEDFQKAKLDLTETIQKVRNNIDELKNQAQQVQQEEGIDTTEQTNFLPLEQQ